MVDRNLIQSLNISDQDIDDQLQSLGTDFNLDTLGEMIQEKTAHQTGTILTGHVVAVIGNDVVVEVGLKSEGTVDVNEFDDPSAIEVGQEVEVFLEEVESDSGLVVLSKRKADRIRGWEWIVQNKQEGDVVTGPVTRKIKGGLLMDIGVPAFLPASQVDIRRPSDIGEFIGQQIEAKILKIDQERRNIVVSRRKLIEDRRGEAKEKLLAEIEEGQTRKGVVKNIADFGAFVDLGGLDGLLHITDMSWGRIGHPSEMVKIDEEIEVVVLNVDREKEKIALGLKQKTASPWDQVEQKYPVGSRIKGEVVNIMSYGAFVKLEEGLEGLVHISEMSWTRRVNHPSEVVSAGQEVEVVVLDIDKEKQEISLGMKQAEVNPWTLVKEKYPPGTVITGTVRNMTNFGAFVEIEEGIDGMLHVSDLSWTRKIGHPSEMLKRGQQLQCVVLAVDEEKMRVSLGLKQLTEDPWLRIIPEHYLPGQIVKGKVTKLTNFGVFVELEDELEGLLHVSELADRKVENPQDVVKVGDEIEVKILRVDSDERKIGLSLKRAQWAAADTGEREGAIEQPVKRRGGLAGEGGMLGSMGNKIIQSIRQQEDEEK
ncbi:MAG: 30S ribosomal protein S1 [Planctomycetes bacterium ADurb.Bin126]|nr:MAG: 30S ribosomal protein S1 [Planctomycetes bacterium ADurb.Bin126]